MDRYLIGTVMVTTMDNDGQISDRTVMVTTMDSDGQISDRYGDGNDDGLGTMDNDGQISDRYDGQ